MELENLGEVFADGRTIHVKSAPMQTLEDALKKVREQRVDVINHIANIVNEIQQQ